MYHVFIEKLVQFAIEAGVVSPAAIFGSTEREIAEFESLRPGKLPEAYAVFLRKMGYKDGGLFERKGIGIEGSEEAQPLAEKLTTHPQCQWRLTKTILPISQWEGYQFLFLDIAEGDDPRLFHYMERRPQPQVVAPAFTAWLREVALQKIEGKPRHDELLREMSAHRDDWRVRKATLDRYSSEVGLLRKRLIDRVAHTDATRGEITQPLEFQKMWCHEIQSTDLYRTLHREGKRIPWGWVSLKDLK